MNYEPFDRELNRLRRRQAVLAEELRRVERANGVNENNDEGEGGGGGGNAIVDEIRNMNLNQEGVNIIRGAIHDIQIRESRQETEAVRMEKKREAAIAAEQEKRLERNELEKMRVNNQRREILIQDSDRELETANLQLAAERRMRRH